MADLLDRIAGDIPGLLHQGSPVPHPRRHNVPCVVVNPTGSAARVAYPWIIDGLDGDSWALADLALDLTDPTGRVHAAWWLGDRPISLLRAAADIGPWALGEIMDAARRGDAMTPTQIDTLARLVLRLAGR